MATKPQTITITNFSGRLSRILNGDMNSGFAKFTNSFGYDPFSKPLNLTWLEQPVDITGPITDLPLAAKQRFEVNQDYIYTIGSTGNLYKIQPNTTGNPNVDSVVAISSVKATTSYNFGASIDFFGQDEKIYVGHDLGVNSIHFDGSAELKVGTLGFYVANVYRPLSQFIGYLVFGNRNNIGLISATTETVVSPLQADPTQTSGSVYGQLTPPLAIGTYITDLDISPDGNYQYITSSGTRNEDYLNFGNDRQAAAASEGTLSFWNGIDQAITAMRSIPSYAVTALHTYLGNNTLFANDALGAGLNDGTAKLVSLPNSKSSTPNANAAFGNFLTWISPEVNPDGTTINGSLFYYGNLDDENPKGLWRMMRYASSLTSGFVYQTPLNIMTNNKYSGPNNALSTVVPIGYGKHYFSTMEVTNNPSSITKYTLQRFLITPTGTGTPQQGVYETQTQLFSKRMATAQVRVYCEPTIAGNSFQLDLIGSDGNVYSNGSFTYNFGDIVDPATGAQSIERINFDTGIKPVYALGIRITNKGTTNMTIKKIEVDIGEEGK